MTIEEFLQKFAEQFYDTPIEAFHPDSEFRQFEEWSSMTGLCVLNMIREEFGFYLDPAAFKTCKTILEVYERCINN